MDTSSHLRRAHASDRWVAGAGVRCCAGCRLRLRRHDLRRDAGRRCTRFGNGDGLSRRSGPAGRIAEDHARAIRRQRAAQATDVGEDVKRMYGVAKPYRIGSGDILNRGVGPPGPRAHRGIAHDRRHQRLAREQRLQRQCGWPDPFKVGGLTEYERLTKALAKFEAPKLTVRIQSTAMAASTSMAQSARPACRRSTTFRWPRGHDRRRWFFCHGCRPFDGFHFARWRDLRRQPAAHDARRRRTSCWARKRPRARLQPRRRPEGVSPPAR